jgi:hypothetical protein
MLGLVKSCKSMFDKDRSGSAMSVQGMPVSFSLRQGMIVYEWLVHFSAD